MTLAIFSFLPWGHYYGAYYLLLEASTPFLNIHWFCDKMGMAGSTLQLLNGFCLLLSYFIFRVILGTWSTISFITHVYSARMFVPYHLYYVYSGCGVFMIVLNIYWFNLMIKSVQSRFRKKDLKVQ